MQRITITIDDDLLESVDALMQRRFYASRSEALRDMVREAEAREAVGQGDAPCVGVLSYVYDHETRALAQRLIAAFHGHHDVTVVSMHVHLDHQSCLEVAVLKGRVAALRELADQVTTQRGVRHASLHLVPAHMVDGAHDHGGGPAPHPHIHT